MARRVKRTTTERDERLAVDYARYSEEMQGSIEDQQGANADVAADEGIRIVRSFADPAQSRSLAERPDLLAMFAYLEENPRIGFVVVNELERLTAGITQRAVVIEMCQRLGITILTEDMGLIDPFDAKKMQEADERAVKARGEVLKVQHRTRRALKQKVKQGRVAMRPAFGTRMKPLVGPDGKPLAKGVILVDERGRRVRSGVLEIEELEIEWLRKIFALADQGMNDEDIARFLTGKVKTKSGNVTWRPNSVAGILTNPLYKGVMVWGRHAVKRYDNGQVYLEVRDDGDAGLVVKDSPLGALVDPELWERVNARRLVRLGELRMNRRINDVQVFDHRVYCLRCGHKMYGRFDSYSDPPKRPRKRMPFRYACSKGTRSSRTTVTKEGFGPPCTKGHTITDEHILQALATFGMEPGGPARVHHRRTKHDQAERQALERRIEIAEAKLKRAKDLYIEGELDKAELDQWMRRRDSEVAAATAELGQMSADPVVEFEAPSYEGSATDFTELVSLLGDWSIPVAKRQAALDRAGIARLYVDRPVVEIEFVGENTGIQRGLLGTQDSHGLMDAG